MDDLSPEHKRWLRIERGEIVGFVLMMLGIFLFFGGLICMKASKDGVFNDEPGAFRMTAPTGEVHGTK